MDIRSKGKYPSNTLSNFAPHPFVLDGVQCQSMEGFLQSLKFDKPHIQVEVCKLTGFAAKKRGSKRTKTWQRVQKLWWNGQIYDRHGEEYQRLLDRAYAALGENEKFKKALLATRDAVLTHSIGHHNDKQTILTEREFVRRLMAIRKVLQWEKEAES